MAHLAEWRCRRALLCAIFLTSYGHGQGLPTKPIADMETKPVYRAAGRETEPKVSVSGDAASQGERSLRVEHQGAGPRRASVSFPVDGAEGFNTVAFDLYCKYDLHATVLDVRLKQQPEGPGRFGSFQGSVKMRSVMDGWTPVRLAESAGLKFISVKGAKPDWGKIREVDLRLYGGDGKTVFYLDNLRFENMSGLKKTANVLYNGSFEIATNPDVPDGWARDLAVPPFGPEVWGIDTTTAYHGANSLRIGVPGKFARSWIKHIRATEGTAYTFSIYLKSDQEDTKARLRLHGVRKKEEELKDVTVGRDWKRHSLTATAKGGQLFVRAYLLSGGVLWLDAAQLEPGTEPTAYAPAAIDLLEQDEVSANTAAPVVSVGEPVKARIQRATQPPKIDGSLDDPCWKEAEELTPFVKLQKDEPALLKSVARMSYDDTALYFAVLAEEPEMKAVRDTFAAVRETGPWGSDLIELFIDLNHDRSSYYHFVANALGQQWQRRNVIGSGSGWSCDWDAAGDVGENSWTVELAIPYTCFDLRPSVLAPGPDGLIGVNVCRSDPRKKVFTSWAFAHGAFHTPAAFGQVSGFDADLRPYRYDMASLDWHRGRATTFLRNHTGKDRRLKLTFAAEAPDGTRQQATAKALIEAGKGAEVSAPLRLRGQGYHSVSLRVADETGRARLISQPTDVHVTGGAVLDLVGTEFDFYSREDEARARCFVEASQERCRNLTMRWRLDGDGARLTGSSQRPVTPGINEWSVPLEGVADGPHSLRVALVEGGETVAEEAKSFRKVPPARHEVRINRWGRFLVCDGKPFFWYGFFDSLHRSPEFELVDQRWEAALSDMKSVDATAVLNYIGRKEHYAKIQSALDQAHAHGIKMWVHLGLLFGYRDPQRRKGRPFSEEEDEQAFAEVRKLIAQHKDHPALLGWTTIDEPGNRPTAFTRDYTERIYRVVKEADPHHPCLFSHITRLGESKVYGRAMDLALIPFHRARDARHDHVFQEFWDAGFPIVTNARCYGAASTAREPTPAEIRTRVYRPLILGARGFCSYTYRGASMHTWREFGRIGKELRELSPILLTPDDRLMVDVLPRGQGLSALLKAWEGRHYLLAVNVNLDQVEATFRLTDVPTIGTVKPMFDTKPARSDAAARAISVTMDAKSTAIYEIAP